MQRHGHSTCSDARRYLARRQPRGEGQSLRTSRRWHRQAAAARLLGEPRWRFAPPGRCPQTCQPPCRHPCFACVPQATRYTHRRENSRRSLGESREPATHVASRPATPSTNSSSLLSGAMARYSLRSIAAAGFGDARNTFAHVSALRRCTQSWATRAHMMVPMLWWRATAGMRRPSADRAADSTVSAPPRHNQLATRVGRTKVRPRSHDSIHREGACELCLLAFVKQLRLCVGQLLLPAGGRSIPQ